MDEGELYIRVSKICKKYTEAGKCIRCPLFGLQCEAEAAKHEQLTALKEAVEKYENQ